MSKLYLITGFLGAGKTTFLKNFIHLFSQQKILLIINEFGQEGIDGVLLSELNTYLNEISGGSVFCSCRLDQFQKVLQQSAEISPDVILVEASGLSDPTGVRKLFSQTDQFPNIDYQGAVCLVDPVRFPKLYKTARICVKQLASSDVAVVNKVDCADEIQLQQTISLIQDQRPDIAIIKTSFGKVNKNFLDVLKESSCLKHKDLPLTADLTLRKMLVEISPSMTPYELQKFIEMFIEVTFRVKGFIQTSEGMYLVDCVSNVASLRLYSGKVPTERIGKLVILSGSGMPLNKLVNEAMGWYPDKVFCHKKGKP